MENEPLPPEGKPTEPPVAEKKPHNPEAEQDLIKLRGIERTLKALTRALSVLENGVRSFSQLHPDEATTGFNVAKGDLVRFRNSAIDTRNSIDQLFKATDSAPMLEDPSPLNIAETQVPDSTLVVARRLTSGLTGCRNAIGALLRNENRLLRKGVLESDLGRESLKRLATLSTVLGHLEFDSADKAKELLTSMKSANLENVVIPIDYRKRRTKPLDPAKVVALREEFEEKRGLFGSRISFELAKEICMQMEDCNQGFSFEELRELFELTNRNLKKELEFLRLIVKPFNVTLVGSFEPRGRPLIAFETSDQQEPSTQSMK